MSDLSVAKETSGVIIDPIQGKKPNAVVIPFNPNPSEGEKTYNPSHPAMFGMAVDGALHAALSGEEKQLLERYRQYLLERKGEKFVSEFFTDVQIGAQQVKEHLDSVLQGRDAYFIKGAPQGSSPKLEAQLYDALRNADLHKITPELGYPDLRSIGFAAHENPRAVKIQNGEEHTFDLRAATPIPPHIVPPEMVDYLVNASLLGHHIHPVLDENGEITGYKDYLKRNIAVPDVLAILLDPHHPKYPRLKDAAEIFTQGIRGKDYFGYKFIGDISSLDTQTIKAGSLLAENAIIKKVGRSTPLPAVSFLLAEGKTLARPTFTAQNLLDRDAVTNEALIAKYEEDFGRTINAFRENWFNIYDAGRKATLSKEEYKQRRQEFEDGIFSFPNEYALAFTSLIGVDNKGSLLDHRQPPESRTVFVVGKQARHLADTYRAKVT